MTAQLAMPGAVPLVAAKAAVDPSTFVRDFNLETSHSHHLTSFPDFIHKLSIPINAQIWASNSRKISY